MIQEIFIRIQDLIVIKKRIKNLNLSSNIKNCENKTEFSKILLFTHNLYINKKGENVENSIAFRYYVKIQSLENIKHLKEI